MPSPTPTPVGSTPHDPAPGATPYACPRCAAPVSRQQRRGLSAPLLGTRRPAVCPECGTGIAWARGPWSLFCAGQWTFVAGALLAPWVLYPALIHAAPITHPLRWPLLALMVGGAALMLFSLRSLRIEQV